MALATTFLSIGHEYKEYVVVNRDVELLVQNVGSDTIEVYATSTGQKQPTKDDHGILLAPREILDMTIPFQVGDQIFVRTFKEGDMSRLAVTAIGKSLDMPEAQEPPIELRVVQYTKGN